MNTQAKTLVIGASEKTQRYSNMAVRSLLKHGFTPYAQGRRAGKIENVVIQTGMPDFEMLDTVTLYLNPKNQEEYYDYILSLKPRRIIFNPGTENPVLQELADREGIVWEEACTLVLLNTGQY